MVERVNEDEIVNLPVDPPEVDTLPSTAEPTGPAPLAPRSSSTIDTRPLADIQRRRMEATRAAQDRTLGRLEFDRQRAEQAFEATGIQPGELPAWDADAQSQRFHTDPIAAFGSVGSVFGMIASAFTRAPMQNALNASAAAMNAIRAGDEQNFQRAWDAWKANNDLTIRRHAIENQHYQNAISMMNTNMTAGRAEMEMLATRFGDERTLFLLNNGLDKDLFDLQRSRADAAEHMRKADQNITQDTVRAQMWDQESRAISESNLPPVEQAGRRLDAWNRIYGARHDTPQQAAFGLLLHEMADQPASKIIEVAQQRGLLARQGVQTRDRMGAEEIERRRIIYERQNIEQGMDPAEAKTQAFRQATREVDSEMARLTGGQQANLEGQSDMFKYSIQTIDRLTSRINQLRGAVGTPGYVQRGREIIGNLLGGSNSTEYQQVAHDIAMLKAWAVQNLLGRGGRPLSQEAANLNRVIQGLGLTDTVQNTLKSYEELRRLYSQMQRDVEARRTRTRVAPDVAAPAPPSAAPTPLRRPSWEDAPVLGQ